MKNENFDNEQLGPVGSLSEKFAWICEQFRSQKLEDGHNFHGSHRRKEERLRILQFAGFQMESSRTEFLNIEHLVKYSALLAKAAKSGFLGMI
jgi:hypothetical protein